MGSSISCGTVHLPTARLVVLQEDAGGLIQEFQEPVKVDEILRERPGFFVCHADSMRYDEYVSPLSAEQELQMEHLYFLLPVTKLRHPLPASDMAALAVKASAAMERSRCRHRYHKLGRRRCCKIKPGVKKMEQKVAGMNHHELISSSSSWRRKSKVQGYNSERMERRERMEIGLRSGSVHYKLQRVASGRKRVKYRFPLRRKLSTIHEDLLT